MYRAAVYIICVLLCVFALSGLNFNNFFKKNHLWEARIFVVIMSLVLGYLLANFLMDFMDATRL